MTSAATRCRTCEHLVVIPDSDGVRRVRRDRVYHCAVPLDIPEFPICVRATVWRSSVAEAIEHMRQMVGPEAGAHCVGWEPRRPRAVP